MRSFWSKELNWNQFCAAQNILRNMSPGCCWFSSWSHMIMQELHCIFESTDFQILKISYQTNWETSMQYWKFGIVSNFLAPPILKPPVYSVDATHWKCVLKKRNWRSFTNTELPRDSNLSVNEKREPSQWHHYKICFISYLSEII